MMTRIINIYEIMMQDPWSGGEATLTENILYDLLTERPAEANISHKRMPTMEEHCAFVRSNPYEQWYLIQDWPTTYEESVFEEKRPAWVGSAYLTKQREVGIFIFNEHKRKGFGKQALELLMAQNPGDIYANISPTNKDSIHFFQSLGFKHIQNTYHASSC